MIFDETVFDFDWKVWLFFDSFLHRRIWYFFTAPKKCNLINIWMFDNCLEWLRINILFVCNTIITLCKIVMFFIQYKWKNNLINVYKYIFQFCFNYWNWKGTWNHNSTSTVFWCVACEQIFFGNVRYQVAFYHHIKSYYKFDDNCFPANKFYLFLSRNDIQWRTS